MFANVRDVCISRVECGWAWDGLKAVPYVREYSRYVGVKNSLQQRPAQDDDPDAEIDDEPGDVHERRDERRGRGRRIEAEPPQ